MKYKNINLLLFILFLSAYNCNARFNLEDESNLYNKNNRFQLDSSEINISKNLKHSIELHTYTRFDWYPEITYNINGRPSTDYLKMKGISWGTTVNYKITLFDKISLITGLGYYRHSFTKLNKLNTQFGEAKAREIDYPSLYKVQFITDKYWYNTLNINIGIGKIFQLKKNFQIETALYANNYFMLSQYYHLTYNPEPDKSQKYRTKNKRYFGTSLLMSLEVTKQIKSSQIGLSIQVPAFDVWKTDAVFPSETNDAKRRKCFRGLSIGMVYNYSFTKK
ncbi:MAG: hypothetical protein M9887_02625 [Chitinophagales bacterium]|nr:hypothetical protein [Chitinophagales bacterium]